ncbi:MAG: hypothetical protein RQ899_11880 [Pseudomonadales bacterium]|nr:hypothetical protein [Pseudomonadales bacterium]
MATESICFSAGLGADLRHLVFVKPTERDNPIYIGVFGDANLSGLFYVWSVKPKPTNIANPTHAFAAGPAVLNDWLDGTSTMVVEWDGNPQGAFVRDSSTMDDCSAMVIQ